MTFLMPTHKSKLSFTRDQMKTMLRLQHEANSVMSDDWVHSCVCDIPYFLATVVEGVEAIDHIGFKWWKKKAPDMPQAVLEAIDVLHFGLSDIIRIGAKTSGTTDTDATTCVDNALRYGLTKVGLADHGEHIMSRELKLLRIGTYTSTRVTHELIQKAAALESMGISDISGIVEPKHVLEQLIYQTVGEGTTRMDCLFLLLEVLGVTAEQAYNIYIGKNVLNKFRTLNGQREDKYFKIWNGQEDNVYLEEFMRDNPNTDVAILMEVLSQKYAACCAEGCVEKG